MPATPVGYPIGPIPVAIGLNFIQLSQKKNKFCHLLHCKTADTFFDADR